MKLFDIKNKNILLTGAAGILGSKYAEILAEQGANLILVDKKPMKAGNATLFEADITKESEWKKIASSLRKKKIHIDVLINNAAGKSENFFAPFEEFPLEDWNEVMGINLTSTMLACRTFGAEMAAKGEGSIINISSIYGVVAPNQSIYEGSEYEGRQINTPAVYSASKSAVIGLTKYLATYWGAKGVRVNVITPGGVYSGQNKKFVKNYSEKVPLGRMGEAEDLFGAVVYLASDASKYVTGQNLCRWRLDSLVI